MDLLAVKVVGTVLLLTFGLVAGAVWIMMVLLWFVQWLG